MWTPWLKSSLSFFTFFSFLCSAVSLRAAFASSWALNKHGKHHTMHKMYQSKQMTFLLWIGYCIFPEYESLFWNHLKWKASYIMQLKSSKLNTRTHLDCRMKACETRYISPSLLVYSFSFTLNLFRLGAYNKCCI